MIGFSEYSFAEIRDVFSNYTCIELDFSSNPYLTYMSIKDKTNKVFICSVVVAKFLTHKLGNILHGYFVIKDSFFNLMANNIKCMDVSHSGLTLIKNCNYMDLNYRVTGHTKFKKAFLKDYSEKGFDLLVSSLLSKKKVEHNSLDDLLILLKKHWKDKTEELLCKAITNHIGYKELDTSKHKYSTRIKKFLIQHKTFRRAIIAFQDIMYNLTPIDTAINDATANRNEVEQLLKLWNPKPDKEKEILFKFNKKPLPVAKRTPKRLLKWSKQKHDIPKSIFEKRKEVFNKNKRKHLSEGVVNYILHPSGIISVKEFLEDIKFSANLKSIKDYYVIGALKGSNIILKSGSIVSVLKQNSNEIIFVKVV